jgi:DnaJ-domain-containing protein 1
MAGVRVCVIGGRHILSREHHMNAQDMITNRTAQQGAFMEFKDYYALLEIASTATQDEIKRSYCKLARKYHPDVSKEPDAE